MVKQIVYLFGISVLLLTACGQGNNPSAGEVLYNTAPTLEGGGAIETEQPAEEAQNEEVDALKAELSTDNPGGANCRVKTPQQIAYSMLPRPNESDHARGPEDAYVTIIEYGDFQ